MGETPELKSRKDVRRGKTVKNRNHRQTLSGRRWITRVYLPTNYAGRVYSYRTLLQNILGVTYNGVRRSVKPLTGIGRKFDSFRSHQI